MTHLNIISLIVALLAHQITAQESTSSNGTTVAAPVPVHLQPVHQMIIMSHFVLMVWVYLFAMPVFIIGMRYFRSYLSGWCFKTHAIGMGVVAGVPMVVAFVLGIVGTIGPNFSNSHTIVGFITVLGSFVQIFSGIVNHIIYRHNKGRTHTPWHNSMHMWLGRIVGILGIVAIPLGMLIRHSPMWSFALYGIWGFLLLLTIIVLEIIMGDHRRQSERKQNKELEEKVGGEFNENLEVAKA